MKPIKMSLSKSTKNTHVYADSNEDSPVPTVYIKKSAFSDPNNPPKNITLVIEEKA